jgi:sulfatase maturation enzyme AslB (radical SAM superfamily)
MIPQDNYDKAICVLPWIHFNAMPNGTTRICCTPSTLDPKYDLGNLHKDGISAIINSDVSKAVRQQMINGEWHTLCSRCKLEEDKGILSKRQKFNIKFLSEDTKNFIDSTAEDGSIVEDDFKMKFWDLRLGNICNFGCRICIDSSNSSYIMLERKLPKDIAVITMDKNKSVWDELLDRHLKYCEEIHFFGGEPMLMKEHWQVLDRMLEGGYTNIRLKYNTNASTLTYAGKHIFEYWRHLNLNCLQLSIDDIETRAEYQRYGTKWDSVLANITEIANEYNQLEFLVAVSIFNIMYLDELIQYFHDKFPTVKKKFMLNIVTFPNHLTPYILPKEVKSQVHTMLNEFKVKYGNSSFEEGEYPRILVNGIGQLEHYLDNRVTCQGDILIHREKCVQQIEQYDAIRGESFSETHPEIASYILNDRFLIDDSF